MVGNIGTPITVYWLTFRWKMYRSQFGCCICLSCTENQAIFPRSEIMNCLAVKVNLRNCLLPLLLVLLVTGKVVAQRDSLIGTYCNVFYVTSDAPEILPFDDKCFVSEQYAITDPTNVRAVGPIEGTFDLFERYQWLIHFYLPTVREADRLLISMPPDFYSKSLKMNTGQFFVTISDNRSSTRFDPIMDNVDFVAVSGSAKVIEWEPAKPGEPFPSYKLQMDLRFKQIDRSQGSPKYIGDPIRIKMMMVIEPKE